MGEKTLNAKLNKHFAAFGAAAAAITGVGIAQQAEAAIVYSGVVNIPVPATTAGVYLNVVTATSGTAAATPGWDINPYAAATAPAFFNPSSAVASRGYVADAAAGPATNLPLGTPIGAASVLNTASVVSGANFTPGVPGLLGFRFLNEAGTTTHFGWARIAPPTGSTSVPTAAGTIIDYAFESTPGASIPAGVVPEPASLGLLALGAMGLVARRR